MLVIIHQNVFLRTVFLAFVEVLELLSLITLDIDLCFGVHFVTFFSTLRLYCVFNIICCANDDTVFGGTLCV